MNQITNKLESKSDYEDFANKINNIVDADVTSESFEDAVKKVADFLESAKQIVDQEEIKLREQNAVIDKDFVKQGLSYIVDYLGILVKNFDSYLNNISKEQFKEYQQLTHKYIGKYFMIAPFPKRAYTKPLGFAGDYKMLYMIQEEQDAGDSLFARIINYYYTNIPMSFSVTNRTNTLVEYIKMAVADAKKKSQKQVNFLSIGCGPALEVKKYLEQNDPGIECIFHLLDFNRETLDFAYNESIDIAKKKGCDINLIEKSILNLLRKKSFEDFIGKKFDFIYCSGLFDYLSDEVCKKVVNIFYNSINSGCRLLVTNMHVNNSDKNLGELLLEWFLIYRDEKQMESFAENLGAYRTFTDSTGVNLCLEIQKKN